MGGSRCGYDEGGRGAAAFVGSRLGGRLCLGSAMSFWALAPTVLESFEEAAALAAGTGAP